MALLVKIGAELSDLKKDLKKATKDITSTGDTFKSVGSTLTKSITLPVLGLGTAALNVTKDFNAAMSEVGAISGATGKDLEALRQKAKDMGEKTKFSATESAEALKYMAMAGWKTNDMLSGLDGILNLAAASGEELGLTSDIVTDALTGFGLSAKDSGHFADVLAKASSNANTNVSLLGESFKYVAPVAGALGYSAEDTAVALGLMANSGIKGSQAGTALRTALTNMVKPTDAMAAKMDKLGIEVANSDGSMKSLKDVMTMLRSKMKGLSQEQQTQAAATIFGKEAMSGMLAIINASDKDFDKLIDQIYNADGAAEQMAATMQDNLQGDITLLGSALEGAGIKIGEILDPAIRSVVSAITSAVGWFNSLSDSQLKVAMAVAGLAAAFGPLFLIIGTGINWFAKLHGSLGVLSTACPKLAGLLTGVGGTISSLALPIGIAIAAIVILWNTSEEFRIAVGEIFEGIKQIFQGLIDFVVGVFTGDWDLAFAGLGNILLGFRDIGFGILDALLAAFNSFSNWLGKVFNTDWTKYFGVFGNTLNSFFATVKNIWSGIKNIFSGIVTFIKGVFTGNWKQAWEGVKSIFKGIFQSLAGIAKAPINAIIGIINGVIDAINKVGFEVPDWVPFIGGEAFKLNIPKMKYLAKGGNVFSGSAIFGEAGPEMLTVSGGTARVTPLSGTSGENRDIINYDKMAEAFIKAIKFLRLYVDDDVLAEIIDERLLRVVV